MSYHDKVLPLPPSQPLYKMRQSTKSNQLDGIGNDNINQGANAII
jgi:hypothetical protein